MRDLKAEASLELEMERSIRLAVERHLAAQRPVWGWRNGRLGLFLPDDSENDSDLRARIHREVIVPGRRKFVDEVDQTIVKYPALSSVFDEVWRLMFRKKFLDFSQYQIATYPATYAIISDVSMDRCNQDVIENLEHGVAAVMNLGSERQKGELAARMRDGDSVAVEAELLALAGFSKEFGRDAISLPSGSPDRKRPEFFVDPREGRFAVECTGLFDQAPIQRLNEHAVSSGAMSWASFGFDSVHDVKRFQRAITKKILKCQGKCPTVLVFTLYTVWLDAKVAEELVSEILSDPEKFKIPSEKVPLGVALVADRGLLGYWPSQRNNDRAERHEALRIKSALEIGFPPRCA